MRVFGQKQPTRMTSARRGLTIFFAALTIGAALMEWAGALSGFLDRHFVSIYMWWVAGAALLARVLAGDETPTDFRRIRRNTVRAVLVGTALPLTVGLVAYGVGWATGFARFSASGLPSRIFGIPIRGSSPLRLFKFLLINLTVGALWSCKSAAGEEIGWRGYMLPRLIDSGVREPVAITGVVWALWHLPLIFGGQFKSVPHSTLSICIFAVDIVGQAYILAWIRLSSGSIWPCVWTHGLWNQLIGESLDVVTEGGTPWLGESGALTTAVVVAFAVVLHMLWPLRPSGIRQNRISRRLNSRQTPMKVAF